MTAKRGSLAVLFEFAWYLVNIVLALVHNKTSFGRNTYWTVVAKLYPLCGVKSNSCFQTEIADVWHNRIIEG